MIHWECHIQTQRLFAWQALYREVVTMSKAACQKGRSLEALEHRINKQPADRLTKKS